MVKNYEKQVIILRPGNPAVREFHPAQVQNMHFMSKPAKSVWTSSLKKNTTSWLEWCSSEEPGWIGAEASVYQPSGRIYHIETPEDYYSLVARYPRDEKPIINFGTGFKFPDFPSVARDYDAVHMASDSLRHVWELNAWDVESTVWLDPTKLIYLSTVKIRGNKLSRLPKPLEIENLFSWA